MNITQTQYDKIISRIFKTHTGTISIIKAFDTEFAPYFDNKEIRRICVQILKEKRHHRRWWHNLPSFPNEMHRHSNIVVLNLNELLIATSTTQPFPGIYRYNLKSNEWNHKPYPIQLQSKLEIEYAPIIAIDTVTNTLYLYHAYPISFDKFNEEQDAEYQKKELAKTKFFIFNLNKYNDVEIVHLGKAGYMLQPQLIYIENQLHCLSHSGVHFIYNKKRQILEEKHSLYPYSLSLNTNVYVPLKRKIFHVGGWNLLDEEHTEVILQYSIDEDKWSECNLKLPSRMEPETCLLTADEKYILIFGPTLFDFVHTDDIYIWNVETMEIKKSVLKLPKSWRNKCSLNAVIMNQNSNLLIYGYLKSCCEIKEYIPDHILRLLMKWYCDDFVYLSSREGAQWKIQIDRIFWSESAATTVWHKFKLNQL